jgi:hypothetical protein
MTEWKNGYLLGVRRFWRTLFKTNKNGKEHNRLPRSLCKESGRHRA